MNGERLERHHVSWIISSRCFGMRHLRLVGLLSALLIAGLAAGVVLAQGSSFIDWWVIAGGGEPSTGGNVAIDDTFGQPIIGLSSGGTVGLGGGYWYGAAGPTAVVIVSFTAEAWDGMILLRWETASEVDMVGFNLYRADAPNGVKLPLNETLIPAQAPGSPGGTRYEWDDDNGLLDGQTYFYWLEIVDLHGSGEVLGPVDAAAGIWRRYLPMVER